MKKRPPPPNPHFLSPHKLDEFEERAAIMEYCGGFSRTEAERLALTEVRKPRPPPEETAQRKLWK